MKYQLSVVALVLCANVAFSAKLDNVDRNRVYETPQFNFGAAASSDTRDLFGGLGDYLPPDETKPCESSIITSYVTNTVTQRPVTLTVTARPPAPRTVVETDYITNTITQRPVTRFSTVINYSTQIQTVPSYITVSTTRFSTVYSTQVRPTTIVNYSTVYSTQVRSTTVSRTIVQTQTQTRTQVNTITLPPVTQYRTNTVTAPPRTSTVVTTRLTTRVQYTTVFSTQVRTNTITRTSTSIRIQPTTVVSVNLSTAYQTVYSTQVVPGPTRTVVSTSRIVSVRTDRPPAVTVRSTVTSIEPCKTTGYQYTTPAGTPFTFG